MPANCFLAASNQGGGGDCSVGFSHVQGIDTFRVVQDADQIVDLTVRNDQNEIYNLQQYLDSSSSSSSASASVPEDLTVILGVKVQFSDSTRIIETPGEIIDAENGLVRFRLTRANTRNTGAFTAQVGVFDGGDLINLTEYYMLIRRNAFSNAPSYAPTIHEIRLRMLDLCARQNYLLDQVEFNDEQILYAMQEPVDEFNEAEPPLNRQYTTRDFPWRSHWVEAVVGYLFQMASFNLQRNRLRYSGGGKVVDDRGRADFYTDMSIRMLDGYREWVKHKKMELNIANGYGGIGSEYGYRFNQRRLWY